MVRTPSGWASMNGAKLTTPPAALVAGAPLTTGAELVVTSSVTARRFASVAAAAPVGAAARKAPAVGDVMLTFGALTSTVSGNVAVVTAPPISVTATSRLAAPEVSGPVSGMFRS